MGDQDFYIDLLFYHLKLRCFIGIILCKTRNKVIAEYALRDVKKPVGISSYVTRLVEKLPQKFVGMLPSVQEIEKELSFQKKGKKGL